VKAAVLIAAAVASAFVAASSASAHRHAPRWTVPWLMKRISGATVHVGTWKGRVEAQSTLCSGEGPAVRWGGIGHWRHFMCTWTTFAPGGISRDVTFRVHTITARRFLITNARFGSD
jgi:hypothetical protein